MPVLVLVVLTSGCGQAASTPGSSQPGPGAPIEPVAALLARPVKLPAVAPTAGCPVTPVTNPAVGVADPRGRGPFYLGGPMPQGAFPWNKTVYIVTSAPATGPILFRGGRIDGTGRLQFSGNPAHPADPGELLESQGGASARFYDQALENEGGGALYLYPSTKGCYAIQVDASSFEDVIVVRAG